MPFGDHTLLLSQEGEEGGLWAFGRNNEGQLGLGHRDHQRQPVMVPWFGPQPVQVDWGFGHSLVLDAEGDVWEAGHCWSNSTTFQRVPELPSIVVVAAGVRHCAAIDTEGDLWVWTSRTHLSWISRACSLPQRVEDLPPLLKVACGSDFVVAEAEEGLWVLGDNDQGQLGLGHTTEALQPTLVHVEECSEGPLRCLAAHFDGVILIDSEGGVFSSGDNSYGQLGRSGSTSKLQRITNIPPMLVASCGLSHTLSLGEDGDVWSWGKGSKGQLGTVNTSTLRQPILVASLKGISALVAGCSHTLAFPQEGGLLVFGCNLYGQLGLDTTNQPTPTLCSVQPALPPSSIRSRSKSGRFL